MRDEDKKDRNQPGPDPRDAEIAELKAKLAAATVPGKPRAEPEPKLFRISIAANTASDANSRSYNSYVIMDPGKYWDRRREIIGLNALPRSVIGSDGDVLPPQHQKRNSLVLERGGEPIDIIICEEQLKELRSDRKNLNIFRVEELGPDTKVKLGPIKPIKLERKSESEDADDLDPK